MLYRERSSDDESTSENDLTPQAIDALVSVICTTSDSSVPERIRQHFLAEYETDAEGCREKILSAFKKAKRMPAVLGKATVRGAVFDVLNDLRVDVEQNESYSSYERFMGEKSIDKGKFFQKKANGYHQAVTSRNMARRRVRGRDVDYSKSSVRERWEYIQGQKIDQDIEKGVRVVIRGERQRSFLVVDITPFCKLVFKSDKVGQKGHIPQYYEVVK